MKWIIIGLSDDGSIMTLGFKSDHDSAKVTGHYRAIEFGCSNHTIVPVGEGFREQLQIWFESLGMDEEMALCSILLVCEGIKLCQ